MGSAFSIIIYTFYNDKNRIYVIYNITTADIEHCELNVFYYLTKNSN